MIEFTTGEVVTSGQGTFAIHASYRKDNKYREQAIHLAEADSQSGIPKSEKIIDIVPSGNPRLNKHWSTRRHNLPNGSFLKFVIRKSNPKIGAFSSIMAAIMLRMRETAALMRIEIDLPFSEGCTKSRLYIEGRFDILTSEQVAELGISRNASGSDEIEMFETGDDLDFVHSVVIEKAVAAMKKAEVKKIAGTSKAITRIKRTRRVSSVD